jgi:hypothetical protein
MSGNLDEAELARGFDLQKTHNGARIGISCVSRRAEEVKISSNSRFQPRVEFRMRVSNAR